MRAEPQLAALYYRLMVEHGHCHTQATVAARLDAGTPMHYEPVELRELITHQTQRLAHPPPTSP